MSSFTFLQMISQIFTAPTYLGKRINKAVYVGRFSSVFYFILSYFTWVVAVCDVVSDATAKQDRLLWHDAKVRAQPLYVQCLNIVTVDRLSVNNRDLASRLRQTANGRSDHVTIFLLVCCLPFTVS